MPLAPSPFVLVRAKPQDRSVAALASLLVAASGAAAQTGGGFDLSWSVIGGGGGSSAGGTFDLTGTIGQADAGAMTTGLFILAGGFWDAAPNQGCYANCDHSLLPPLLNVTDFACFLQKFSTGDPYANCDGSTTPPVLNVSDFTCFLQRFSEGCP
jgi:hypothetical protein